MVQSAQNVHVLRIVDEKENFENSNGKSIKLEKLVISSNNLVPGDILLIPNEGFAMPCDGILWTKFMRVRTSIEQSIYYN